MIEFDDLSELQKNAFESITGFKEEAYFLKGYAGTGKTTMLAVLANHFGARCCVLAPTNKAATVLRNKGISSAKTIHSTLYAPMEIIIPKKNASGETIYIKKEDGTDLVDLETGAKIPEVQERRMEFQLKPHEENSLPPIALVDESSMLTTDVFKDLMLSFEQVICFGDGFQLPPVGSKDVFSKEQANFFLDEVHRTALENPIIRYATSIRNGEELPLESLISHEIKTCKPTNTKLYQTLVDKNVQAICWTNRTRHQINNSIRAAKGYRPDFLENGEQIIATQNVRVHTGDGVILKFYNGEVVEIEGEYEAPKDHFMAKSIKTTCDRYQLVWPFWNEGFFELKDNYQAWNAEMERRKHSNNKPKFGQDFDFAYCMTAHKSQGSEFENVAVWDQRKLMRRDSTLNKQRWYYTAITRAKERLLIVR